jgi:hypothetical protein
MQAATFTSGARLGVARPATRAAGARRSVVQPVRAAADTKEMVDDLGFKLMRKGVKEAAKETLLTPRWVCQGTGGPRAARVCGAAPALCGRPAAAPARRVAPLSPHALTSRSLALHAPPTLQLLHHRL